MNIHYWTWLKSQKALLSWISRTNWTVNHNWNWWLSECWTLTNCPISYFSYMLNPNQWKEVFPMQRSLACTAFTNKKGSNHYTGHPYYGVHYPWIACSGDGGWWWKGTTLSILLNVYWHPLKAPHDPFKSLLTTVWNCNMTYNYNPDLSD